MTKLNCYLNFQGNAEEAFNFYKAVFGGDHYYIMRFKDAAVFPGKEKLSEQDRGGRQDLSGAFPRWPATLANGRNILGILGDAHR
jgi:hypothetical protein